MSVFKDQEYKFIQKLGRGHFGDVNLVQRKSDQKLLALKMIQNLDTNIKIEIPNEAKILQEIEHPNIIKCYGYFKSFKFQFQILLEYAEKGDLLKYTQQIRKNSQKIPEKQIINYVAQLIMAMQYLHEHFIIHRDIKLQNIFMTEQGLIKLGDFGIAKLLQIDNELAQTTLGTPYYVSPEICLGKKYDYKSDMWMLGCAIYELCELEKPFQGDNIFDVIQNVVKEPHKRISQEYSDFLQNMVDQLLQKEPDMRPNCKQLLNLNQIQDEIKFLKRQFPQYQSFFISKKIRDISPISDYKEFTRSRHQSIEKTISFSEYMASQKEDQQQSNSDIASKTFLDSIKQSLNFNKDDANDKDGDKFCSIQKPNHEEQLEIHFSNESPIINIEDEKFEFDSNNKLSPQFFDKIQNNNHFKNSEYQLIEVTQEKQITKTLDEINQLNSEKQIQRKIDDFDQQCQIFNDSDDKKSINDQNNDSDDKKSINYQYNDSDDKKSINDQYNNSQDNRQNLNDLEIIKENQLISYDKEENFQQIQQNTTKQSKHSQQIQQNDENLQTNIVQNINQDIQKNKYSQKQQNDHNNILQQELQNFNDQQIYENNQKNFQTNLNPNLNNSFEINGYNVTSHNQNDNINNSNYDNNNFDNNNFDNNNFDNNNINNNNINNNNEKDKDIIQKNDQLQFQIQDISIINQIDSLNLNYEKQIIQNNKDDCNIQIDKVLQDEHYIYCEEVDFQNFQNEITQETVQLVDFQIQTAKSDELKQIHVKSSFNQEVCQDDQIKIQQNQKKIISIDNLELITKQEDQVLLNQIQSNKLQQNDDSNIFINVENLELITKQEDQELLNQIQSNKLQQNDDSNIFINVKNLKYDLTQDQNSNKININSFEKQNDQIKNQVLQNKYINKIECDIDIIKALNMNQVIVNSRLEQYNSEFWDSSQQNDSQIDIIEQVSNKKYTQSQEQQLHNIQKTYSYQMVDKKFLNKDLISEFYDHSKISQNQQKQFQQKQSIIDDDIKKQSQKSLNDQKINKQQQQQSINDQNINEQQQQQSINDQEINELQQQQSIIDDEINKQQQQQSINDDDIKKLQQVSIIDDNINKQQQQSIIYYNINRQQQQSIIDDDIKKQQQQSINDDDIKKLQQVSIIDDNINKQQQQSIIYVDINKQQQQSINQEDIKRQQQQQLSSQIQMFDKIQEQQLQQQNIIKQNDLLNQQKDSQNFCRKEIISNLMQKQFKLAEELKQINQSKIYDKLVQSNDQTKQIEQSCKISLHNLRHINNIEELQQLQNNTNDKIIDISHKIKEKNNISYNNNDQFNKISKNDQKTDQSYQFNDKKCDILSQNSYQQLSQKLQDNMKVIQFNMNDQSFARHKKSKSMIQNLNPEIRIEENFFQQNIEKLNSYQMINQKIKQNDCKYNELSSHSSLVNNEKIQNDLSQSVKFNKNSNKDFPYQSIEQQSLTKSLIQSDYKNSYQTLAQRMQQNLDDLKRQTQELQNQKRLQKIKQNILNEEKLIVEEIQVNNEKLIPFTFIDVKQKTNINYTEQRSQSIDLNIEISNDHINRNNNKIMHEKKSQMEKYYESLQKAKLKRHQYDLNQQDNLCISQENPIKIQKEKRVSPQIKYSSSQIQNQVSRSNQFLSQQQSKTNFQKERCTNYLIGRLGKEKFELTLNYYKENPLDIDNENILGKKNNDLKLFFKYLLKDKLKNY